MPPHCRAISKQTIDTKNIAKEGKSSLCKLAFQSDFLGGFSWIRNITAKKVGAERIGFIQKILDQINKGHQYAGKKAYHRQVVLAIIPPPIRGPQRNETPDTAPKIPFQGGSLERGTDRAMIVMTPDKIPPAPVKTP